MNCHSIWGYCIFVCSRTTNLSISVNLWNLSTYKKPAIGMRLDFGGRIIHRLHFLPIRVTIMILAYGSLSCYMCLVVTFVLPTRELYKHYVKETIIIPQYNDADEQIDHVSSPNMAVVHTQALHICDQVCENQFYLHVKFDLILTLSNLITFS